MTDAKRPFKQMWMVTTPVRDGKRYRMETLGEYPTAGAAQAAMETARASGDKRGFVLGDFFAEPSALGTVRPFAKVHCKVIDGAGREIRVTPCEWPSRGRCTP